MRTWTCVYWRSHSSGVRDGVGSKRPMTLPMRDAATALRRVGAVGGRGLGRDRGNRHEPARDVSLGQLGARELRADPTVDDHEHAIAQVGQLLEVTRADHYGRAGLSRGDELTVQIGLGTDVDALSGLIEQEHRRLL